jgi:hypothetical protein
MKMPENIFEPMPEDIVQHRIGLINSLSIPGVYTHTPLVGGINLRSIGLFLGLVDDVSPEISYTLTITADVEIVIFSVSAVAIAKIFEGTQKPGKYSFFWNGKDDSGKKASSGDYIAEVRIGQKQYVRKRIVIE